MDPVVSELQDMVQELYRHLGDLQEEVNSRLALIEDRLAKLASHEGLEALRLTRLGDIERRLDRLEERTGFLS